MQKNNESSTPASKEKEILSTFCRALLHYGFAPPEIKCFLSFLLPSLSDRTIKNYCRLGGLFPATGRVRARPHLKARDEALLITLAHIDLKEFGGNMLHLLDHVSKRFGVTPKQFLTFMTDVKEDGKTMRLCAGGCQTLFPSMSSEHRFCSECKGKYRRAAREMEIPAA